LDVDTGLIYTLISSGYPGTHDASHNMITEFAWIWWLQYTILHNINLFSNKIWLQLSLLN